MTSVHFPAEEFILSWTFLSLIYPFLKGFQSHFNLSWPTYPSMTSSEPHLSFPERLWNPIIISWMVPGHIYALLHLSKTHLVSSLMGIWKMFLYKSVHWEYKIVQRSRLYGPLLPLFLYMWNNIRAHRERYSKPIFKIWFKFHKNNIYSSVSKGLLSLNGAYYVAANASMFRLKIPVVLPVRHLRVTKDNEIRECNNMKTNMCQK